MERILDVISQLRLDRLAEDWVDSVFYFEFTGFEDIPSTYERILESIHKHNVFTKLLECVDDIEESDDITWASLSQEIAHRSLLAVIGHYIKHGIDYVASERFRDDALVAARVYFRLLMIPGARAYNIYHSQLFAHTISCLNFPKMMCEKSDQYRNVKTLSSEVNFVLKSLSEYVVDLREIILLLKLTPDDINFEDILSNLVEVTGGAITGTINTVDKILVSAVSTVIYQVITCMLSNYGDQPNPKAIELLFKCMVPKLIAASGDTKTPTSYVRASYVTYAGVILASYGKASFKSFITMLEHICYNTDSLERAEARTARSELVVGLMSLLPDRWHRKFLKWLLVLSTTAKIVHRHLALEILARLLNNEPEINEQRETLRHEIEKQSAAANVVSGVDPDGPPGAPPPNAVDPDDDSQDSQHSKENEEPDDGEDEVAGILRQQSHTVPISGILACVYACAQDASSTVRQRALAVLADSVASERAHMRRALEELNGAGSVSRLVELAARGASDERAVVRRGACALLLRLLSAVQRPLSAEDLATLVGLCRDAAITVRSAAISAIGDLLVQRPGEAIIEAFLSGPMHQMSDPETKVQDQVKGLIDQIVMKRLVKYTEGSGNEDVLPWMFLEGIIEKNMARNLQNACALLAKTDKCISPRLVDILSSYVGALGRRRDVQALLLLNSVAPHVDYSEIGFALDYYYKLVNDTGEAAKPIDSQLLALVLELLSAWAQFARPPDRAALRDSLVTRLATAPDDGCRIQSAALAKQLDPTNLIWANELLQLSEQRALAARDLREALRAADLSLVAPTPPSPALMQLFLAAIRNPPKEWSGVQLGSCVAGAGRLCVRSRAAAGAAAPSLADLLRSAAPLQARLNALLALADISQRYTNIVEPLMGTICGCLEPDTPARLRRAAVRALTELLLSGYLRLRTPLYYNYCALLADADRDVREPAEYYVTSCLRVDTICQNFVDCVLHYNEDNNNSLDFDARQLIYDVMLQRLSIVQKLNAQCRLAREVLLHAAELADDAEEIPQALHNAMLDTIKILTGPRMRLPGKQTGEMADIDDLQERVTTNIVSHKMKRTVAEVLVPAVMRLYARLGAGGGQLSAYLVLLAQDLEIDYKQEIEELLENDEELVTRIALFRENHAVEPGAGNSRNLVTASGPPEPATPRPQRKRAPRRDSLKKRSLQI